MSGNLLHEERSEFRTAVCKRQETGYYDDNCRHSGPKLITSI